MIVLQSIDLISFLENVPSKTGTSTIWQGNNWLYWTLRHVKVENKPVAIRFNILTNKSTMLKSENIDSKENSACVLILLQQHTDYKGFEGVSRCLTQTVERQAE